ncbi:hypothetical protein [Methanosarcina sp.]|uniref:hypothetical protein n=1 Tax=Methanosarcina sp. TaxID=2213 RepID=UPI003BB7929E
MAEVQLKRVATFSVEALQIVIAKLNEEEQSGLKVALDAIEKQLPKKKSKMEKNKSDFTETKVEQFQNKIRLFDEKLSNFEKRQLSDDGESLTNLASLPFSSNFKDMNLRDLVKAHTHIERIEGDLNIHQNILHFMRYKILIVCKK